MPSPRDPAGARTPSAGEAPAGEGDAPTTPATTPAARAAGARCPRCGQLPEPGVDPANCARCGTPRRVAGAAPASPAAPSPAARALQRTVAVPGGFLRGLEGAVRGAIFVTEHPLLWLWILVPLLINAATFGALVLFGWKTLAPLLPDFALQDWGWFDFARLAVAPVLDVLLGLVLVLASLIVTLLVSGVVNAPFYDLLSEKVESAALRRPDPGRPWAAFLGDMLHALGAALALALRQVAIMALLFLLSFTAVGAPLFVAAGFFFTGFALMDVTLARKRYTARQRMAWARRHWSLLMGLGLPVNLIPPLQPFGIVGATLLYLVLDKE